MRGRGAHTFTLLRYSAPSKRFLSCYFDVKIKLRNVALNTDQLTYEREHSLCKPVYEISILKGRVEHIHRPEWRWEHCTINISIMLKEKPRPLVASREVLYNT